MDYMDQPGFLMKGLQTPYIFVLNICYELTKWIGEKVRNLIVSISCFGLVVYAALQYSEIIIRDYVDDVNYRMLIICVLVALLAVFGMKEKARPVAWNWPAVAFFYLLAIGILAARVHHGLATGYVLFALFLLVIIPAYGLVWTAKEAYTDLFFRLSIALIIVGIIFYVGSLIVWPYAPYLFLYGRYTGLSTNPNILAMFYICVMAGAIFLIYHSKRVVLSTISIGCSIAMLYLSESRTAMLAGGVAALAALICYLRKREDHRIRPQKLIIVVVLSLVVSGVAVFALHAPIKFFSYYGIEAIKEDFDSDSKFSLDEYAQSGFTEEEITDVSSIFIEDMRQNQAIKLGEIASAEGSRKMFFGIATQGLDLNALGSGRIEVYKWLIQNTTLWGVDREANPIIVNGRKFSGAHNTVLDFAYQCGAFTGLWCFLLKIVSVIFVIRFLFGRKEFKEGNLFTIMMILLFVVESTLEIQTLPSSRDITCYYYMMMPMVFAGIRRKENNVKERRS